jgi:protein gp37
MTRVLRHKEHDETFNFWIGCQKISEGCRNCYMYVQQKKRGIDPSKVKRCKNWLSADIYGGIGEPYKWQAKAAQEGVSKGIFTCNYSDFFLPEADEWRAEAWELIRETPNLIWQIASKRVDKIADRLPTDWGDGYPNVWLGTSVEMKKYFWRLDMLRQIPCVLRWVDCAPILEELTPELGDHLDGFGWVLVGAEQGSTLINPRPYNIQWVRNIRDLCAKKGILFYHTCAGGKYPKLEPLLDGKAEHAIPQLTTNASIREDYSKKILLDPDDEW